MSDSPSVGILGLGAIGRIYCGHLREAFPGLHAFDLDRERVDRSGAVAAGSARELGAACELVVVSLPDPTAVRAAVAGVDGLLEGARPGSVVVDTSTISPAASREMCELARERGVDYLDAPVSGGEPYATGVDGARAASMTFMVGGDAEAFERARRCRRSVATSSTSGRARMPRPRRARGCPIFFAAEQAGRDLRDESRGA
jgi:3-hydroxyisobutyrate dehydrogenase-like beta-hydroxyacid dehydrogenase